MNKSRIILIKIIYIAIFSSLCFIGTMISIPFGASKVHLGNFFCILTGLLCGGLIGGISGSLGMGLNDIVFGYSYTTYLRTFILKFLMGYIAGTLFQILIKKKCKGTLLIFIALLFTVALFAFILYEYLIGNEKYTILHLVVSIILFMLVLFITIFTLKKGNILKCLSFSLLVALTINVIGEFYLRLLINMSLGITYDVAFLESLTKLPAGIFTSTITIIFILPIYFPLYKATYRINKCDSLSMYINNKT